MTEISLPQPPIELSNILFKLGVGRVEPQLFLGGYKLRRLEQIIGFGPCVFDQQSDADQQGENAGPSPRQIGAGDWPLRLGKGGSAFSSGPIRAGLKFPGPRR